MARILPDREIKKLIGSVLISADEQCLNPNGIELRLGGEVRFDSTGEHVTLGPHNFLKVNPGESIIVSSLEKLDFTAQTVQAIYPDKMLMGLITPTTTMMREGISQVSTKVDAGFRGFLNWGFRNSSIKEFIIQYGEPIFKLTLFLLGSDESPDVAYGETERHTYQDTEGVKLSARRIPSQISKKSIIASSFDKLDPKRQLREAGYPFDHIGTELMELHGKWEIVSSDVRTIKEDFQRQTEALGKKIADETRPISERLDDFRKNFLEQVENLFQRKFLWVVGTLVAALTFLGAICNFLRDKGVDTLTILVLGICASILIVLLTYLVARRQR